MDLGDIQLIELDNDVVKWRVLVNMAMNFSVPKK
jgi:hypothetical protein